VVALTTIVALLGGLFYWRPWSSSTETTTQKIVLPVTVGDLSITVEGAGSVEPARSLSMSFESNGQIKEVMVKPGDRVKAGQALARLDDSELQLQVQQAKADVSTARARLTQAREGTSVPQDITQAEASVTSARANLAKTQSGNVTAADIANAEAAVRSAEAQLIKARTNTTAEMANAEAAVRSAQAQLRKAETGSATPADIANAEAAVRSAQAQLQKAQRGPSPDQVSAAQTALVQAQQNYQKTAATASANKSTTEQNMLQAADSVRSAQDAYSTAYWENQQAQSEVDPKTGRRIDEKVTDPDVVKQQYADALRAAELALSQAQSRLEQAKIAFENAKQQEVNEVTTAQVQVDDAQVKLDELQKGPKPEDVTIAQSALDQARANLQKLQQGGTAADITIARASLDQARANLQKLKQGGAAADIASARAAVDQARASLQKLRQGGTAADITAAKAQVDQSLASLEKLTAPKPESDIEIAQAAVDQAEAKLTAANLTLKRTTLTAPFEGTIAAVNIMEGSYMAASGADAETAPITIVDTSSMQISVKLSENDVARVQVGQPVSVSFDALENQVLTGTVDSVAPTATKEQNVVTYEVIVRFDPGSAAIKSGMSASASITIETRKQVVQVPSQAIQTEGPRKTVKVVQGNDTVTVEVETGLSNDAMTEIVKCIRTGNQCLHQGDQVKIEQAGGQGMPVGGPPNGWPAPGGAAPGGSGNLIGPGGAPLPGGN
jgi:HlyD family secretion protein